MDFSQIDRSKERQNKNLNNYQEIERNRKK